jgi:NAD(P)-dependent dehydrogenase (short-subunit alcohol dehydrogenase family)
VLPRLKRHAGDGEVRFTATDVSERLDVHNLVAKTIDAFGSIDALVNNAGIVHSADFLDLEEADFDRVHQASISRVRFCAGKPWRATWSNRLRQWRRAGLDRQHVIDQ